MAHLFVLPNGSGLKFARPFMKGPRSNWYRTEDAEDLRKAAKKSKSNQFLLNLWSSKTEFHLVAADFDEVPSNFDDFDAFAISMRARFSSEQAIVTRSSSSKVKVFFLIQLPHGEEMKFATAKEFIKSVFRSETLLLKCIDLSLGGLQLSYLNQDVIEALHFGLRFLTPFYSLISHRALSPLTSSSPPFQTYKGDLTKLGFELPKNSARERYLRILLAMPGLISNSGYGLPNGKFGMDIGVCEQRASQIRQHFVKNGLIILHDSHYAPGVKGQMFRASGPLLTVLRTLYPSFDVSSEPAVLPTHIEDRNWHASLGKIVGRLRKTGHSREEVLSAVSRIKGSEKKDRLKQAAEWFDWFNSQSTG